jgi:hypothetical protein
VGETDTFAYPTRLSSWPLRRVFHAPIPRKKISKSIRACAVHWHVWYRVTMRHSARLVPQWEMEVRKSKPRRDSQPTYMPMSSAWAFIGIHCALLPVTFIQTVLVINEGWASRAQGHGT